MVSCIEIETASLVFASISLLSTCMGTLVCVGLIVYINVLTAYLLSTTQRNVASFTNYEIGIANYGLYINIGLAVSLSIILIALAFAIILTKGLISKKAHLVKAYFIYGVTMNSLSAFSSLLATLTYQALTGLLGLLGCFVYAIILVMIKTTYLKLANPTYKQFGQEKIESEKPYA